MYSTGAPPIATSRRPTERTMQAPRLTHSLKARIVVSYSLILILGGVSTSAIGIYVTGRAILLQARLQVEHGLSTASSIHLQRRDQIRQCVELVATGGRLGAAFDEDMLQPDTATAAYLGAIRAQNRVDFLSVADATGRVILRTTGAETTGDNVSSLAPVARAIAGESAASTEIVPNGLLLNEDPALAERARIELVYTPEARPRSDEYLNSGMVMMAAAPVLDDDGLIIAVLYAGQLLNNSDPDPAAHRGHALVDEIKQVLFPSLQYENRQIGTATIFQDDVRITTNVMTAQGKRAIGTRVSREVYDAVMVAGRPWMDRAFVVTDWYITAYEPIVNLAGSRIGMLYVGLLERPYTAVRDNVTLIFALIALFCFILIVVVTYFLTRSLLRPIEQMVSVSQSISAGDLSRRVDVTDQSELGELASSFNAMLDRINQMKSQLEQWAKTLEQKVEQRTQQLIKVQAEMARTERLASVGQLAAGVAHEINNPLGGILTFASLVLEDLPPDSPMREDVEEIVRQTRRCRKIVTGLLEFSRQGEPQMAPANINQVVSQTLGLVEKQAIFHNIQIVRKFDPEMPETVIDESHMQQVFMNILLNACDAMEQRGTLTVETGHDASKKTVFTRFTDTGCGIPKEILGSIFDPFFTTKDPGKGTGLGMAVAYGIVTGHGGRLEVDSEVGKGTTFTITIPLQDEA
ncbi:MAG: cache domain-containing protein [Planctomycetes bacterium]|nr:cache domain-containing protein [Planctomycetota bacterium]